MTNILRTLTRYEKLWVRAFSSQLLMGNFNYYVFQHAAQLVNPSVKTPLPIMAQIEPTNVCNLDCQFCSRRIIRKERLGTLSFENFRKMIDQIPSLLFVALTGLGEPMLNKDLTGMAQYLKLKGISSMVATNCTEIQNTPTNTLKKLFYFDRICISLDAATKKVYEKIRIGADFKQTINNIRILKNLKEKINCNTDISINCVVCKINQNEMSKIIELANDLKIDEINFTSVRQWVGMLRPEEHKRLSNISLGRKSLESLEADLKIKFNEWAGPDRCRLPFISTYITWDGYVTPCCMRDAELFHFGNIFESDFKTIWNSGKFQSFRLALKTRKIPFICQSCPS